MNPAPSIPGEVDPPFRDLLGRIVQVLDLPASEARSLPPEAYTSPALLQRERERIFRGEWICVGRVDEIPETGDYFTTEVDAVPLIVLRRIDRTVAAMLNICRHHYSQVANGVGNTSRFCCPYHAWTYDLDGRLIAAPRMSPSHAWPPGDCRLGDVRVETWGGFIYVNLDADARSLAPRLSGLGDLLRNYRIETMNTVWHRRETWRTNWKVLTENFMEAYHIPVTHRETLLPFAPVEGIEILPGGEGYCFYRHRVSGSGGTVDPSLLVPNPDLTDHERRYAYIGGVFPSHVFSVAWDWIFWLSLQPQGVGEVVLDWGIGGAVHLPRNQERYDGFPYPALVEEINAEDRLRVESVQRGAESGFAIPGPLSVHEQPIWWWLQYYASRVV